MNTVARLDSLTTTGAWTLEDAGDGISILVFDLPDEKLNKLSEAVLTDLDKILASLAEEKDLKALIVLGGKPDSGTFIAGADINEIRSIEDPQDAALKAEQGQSVLHRFSTMPAVTISAIHGNCLGGGTELSLACDLRIASLHDKTKIGLPEVQLGILPGFGGTQRLPRRIGLTAALPIILTGKPLDVRKAYKLGVVDRVVYPPMLRDEAIGLAKEAIAKNGKSYRPRKVHRPLLLRLMEALPPGRSFIKRQARKDILKRIGSHYPAPLKALEAVVDGYSRSLKAGLRLEAKLIGELIASPTCKNLIDLFLTSQSTGRSSKADPEKPSLCPVAGSRVGLLGAGVMGGGIAALLTRKNYRVRMKDISNGALQIGMQRVHEIFKGRVKRRRMSRQEMANCLAATSPTLAYDGFDQVPFVIEAVVENMDVKKKVLAEVEAQLPPDAIFASNTSALSITELQSAAQRPDRVVGLHFFNPVERMPLVEIIYGDKTAPEVVDAAEEFAKKIGKTPVRVKDAPGFAVNRILGPYLNEAVRLFEEGYSALAIDAFVKRFGMPMGPFELIDEVGLDVASKVGLILNEAFGERARPSDLLNKVIGGDRKPEEMPLGRKVGRGFYLHAGKKKTPNDEVMRLGGTARPDDPDLWLKRLVFPVVNEAAYVLQDGVVETAAEVDLAMVMGTGFAPFRGGPLKYADSLGAEAIVSALSALREPRLAPCDLLQQKASEKQRFYETAKK